MIAACFLVPATAQAQTRAATDAGAKAYERRLYADTFAASSYLSNDWNRFQENYHPNYVGDDDPKTAWTEGAEGHGSGEWLKLAFTELDETSKLRLRLRNGYQKSKRLFGRNARGKEVAIKVLPSGQVYKKTLEDKWGWQDVVIDIPAQQVAGVELLFTATYDGSRYADLCVSDLQIYATSTVPDNPSFERGKKKRLLQWKKQRLRAASLFKSSAAKKLPIAAGYERKAEKADKLNKACRDSDDRFCYARAAVDALGKQMPEHKDAVARARAAIDKQFADWGHVRIKSQDRRTIPPVDNVFVPSAYESIFSDGSWAMDTPIAREVGYFNSVYLNRVFIELKDTTPLDAIAAKPRKCRRGLDKTYQYAWTPQTARSSTDGGSTMMRELLVVECGTFEERDGEFSAGHWQLLVFDSDGRLELSVKDNLATVYEWDKVDGSEVVARATQLGGYSAERVQYVARAAK